MPIRCDRLFLSQHDGYLILKKLVQILDMQYLAYVANFRENSCVQFLLHNLSNSTLPVFVKHATCSATHLDRSIQEKAFLGHFSHSK